MELAGAALLIAFLAATAQAVTGFGFALVLVPLLSLIYDPQSAVIVSLSLGLVSKAPILVRDHKFVQVRLIAPLAVAGLVGVTVGTRVLLVADPSLMQLIIGVTVVVLAALLLCNLRWHLRHERLASAFVGLISGLITGSTSMGGPPVVLFGVNQSWSKERLRANTVAFFMLTGVFGTALLTLAGALTPEILRMDALMLPGVALGLLFGNVVFRRVPRDTLYRAVVLFVMATGTIGAASGLQGLITALG